MAQVLTTIVIARLTFREARRRWVLWVALALGLLFLTVYALGFSEINKDIQRSSGVEGRLMAQETHNFLIIMGLYVVNFLTLIMTVLTSVDTLSGEIASGTIHTLVSKPVQRWELLIGKWLGFTVMLTLYLLFMAGGVCLVGYWVAGYLPNQIWSSLILVWLNIPLFLGVSFLGGASLSTLANGVVAFGLYGVAFIGGWIEQAGSFLNNQTAVNIGIVCSLIMPSDSLWRLAAFRMQTPMAELMGFSFFSSSSVPSTIMVWYSIFYAFFTLTLAMRAFRYRDL